MFEHDEEFSPKSVQELREIVENPRRSVVFRGRSIAALGRKAKQDPSLAEILLRWASDPVYQRTEWFGTVTLAWVAALAVGYSQTDPTVRAQLSQVLAGWEPSDATSLRRWAREENWLTGL